MNDGINQLGKYLRSFGKNADLAIKRTYVTEPSVERIRDVFDPEFPFKGAIDVPNNTSRVTIDVNFGRRLPNIGCCGDCFCGTTESYTSDSLVDGSLYTTVDYVPNSTVIYLDGAPATRNTDYVEIGTNQIDFLVAFSVATISYVYFTGNCTECIDIHPCIDFGFFSNLATVFADRFDNKPIERPLDDPAYTVGGCGRWTIGEIVPYQYEDGAYAAGVIDTALLGGPGRLSGATYEIICAVGEEAPIELEADGAIYTISYPSSSTMQLRIQGSAKYKRELTGNIEPAGTIDKFQTFSIDPDDALRRRFVRAAQFPTGSWALRTWYQDEDEANAVNLVATIGDADLIPSAVEAELVLFTIQAVQVTCLALQTIKVGAALDAGDYSRTDSLWGYHLQICRHIPDFATGDPYFGDCSSETISSTQTMDTIPDYAVVVSFPVIIGDTPPDGSGRVAAIEQTLAAISTEYGHAGTLKIKGEVSASFITDTLISVAFESFPAGEADPGYNNVKYGGGTLISSLPVLTNGGWYPFEVLVSGYPNARWGVVMPEPDAWAASLPFIPGPFLFPPVHTLNLSFRYIDVEALNSVECTAQDVCGLC